MFYRKSISIFLVYILCITTLIGNSSSFAQSFQDYENKEDNFTYSTNATDIVSALDPKSINEMIQEFNHLSNDQKIEKLSQALNNVKKLKIAIENAQSEINSNHVVSNVSEITGGVATLWLLFGAGKDILQIIAEGVGGNEVQLILAFPLACLFIATPFLIGSIISSIYEEKIQISQYELNKFLEQLTRVESEIQYLQNSLHATNL